MGSVGSVNTGDFVECSAIININLARQIAKSSHCNQTAMRIEGYEVAESRAEVMQRLRSMIK